SAASQPRRESRLSANSPPSTQPAEEKNEDDRSGTPRGCPISRSAAGSQPSKPPRLDVEASLAGARRSQPAMPAPTPIILTAPCPQCNTLLDYDAIRRRFVCRRPSCEQTYRIRNLCPTTIATHCDRCGHIMALAPECDVFLCSNPRC